MENHLKEQCEICGCHLHRSGGYAEPTPEGRSHASRHHCVAERFFGRSKNRAGEIRKGIFDTCPWGAEGKSLTLCYDCHEELIHNPVFLPEDIRIFADLVRDRGLKEIHKSEDRGPLAGRIILMHEVISAGLNALMLGDESSKSG